MEARRFQLVALMLVVGLTFILNWSFSTGGQTESSNEIQQLIRLVQNLEVKVDQLIEKQEDNAQIESLKETLDDFLDDTFPDLVEKFNDLETNFFLSLDDIIGILGDICFVTQC